MKEGDTYNWFKWVCWEKLTHQNYRERGNMIL